MVEATLIYPMVVLSIVAIIFTLDTAYSHVAVSSSLHLELNDMAGEYSETYEISPDAAFEADLDRGVSKINGTVSLGYMTGGILKRREDETKKDSALILNEKRHMRVVDHVLD